MGKSRPKPNKLPPKPTVVASGPRTRRSRNVARDEVEAIQKAIAALRQSSGLSARKLAEDLVDAFRWDRAGSYVSQLERGKIVADVAGYLQLAHVAAKESDRIGPIIASEGWDGLVEEPILAHLPPPPAFAQKRRSEAATIERQSSIWPRAVYRDFTPIFPGNFHRCVEVMVPGTDSRSDDHDYHVHSGEEFFLVEEGAIEVQLVTPRGTSKWERLAAGESSPNYIWFPAFLPHRYRACDSKPSKAIAVYADPRGDLVEAPQSIAVGKDLELSTASLGVGRRIREIREQAGHTRKSLADSAAERDCRYLSPRLLAEIEDGRLVPNIYHVVAIANALDTTVTALLYPIVRCGVVGNTASGILHARREHQSQQGHAWIRGRPLAQVRGQQLHPMITKIARKDLSADEFRLARHDGQELIIVMEGELQVHILTRYAGYQRPLPDRLAEDRGEAVPEVDHDPADAVSFAEISKPSSVAGDRTELTLVPGDALMLDANHYHAVRATGDRDHATVLSFHWRMRQPPVFARPPSGGADRGGTPS